jgi:hypothetical protein
MTVYVIGIPQCGGAWLSNERCYGTFEQAEKVLLTKYAGLGCKVFSLHLERE